MSELGFRGVLEFGVFWGSGCLGVLGSLGCVGFFGVFWGFVVFGFFGVFGVTVKGLKCLTNKVFFSYKVRDFADSYIKLHHFCTILLLVILHTHTYTQLYSPSKAAMIKKLNKGKK